ncbi:MAG: imelysin family protein [Rikenellaceae bacterium]
MKNLFKFTMAAFALAAVVTFASCSDDDDQTGTVIKFEVDETVVGSDVLVAYVDNVVIPRYENLAEASKTLYNAVDAITDADATTQASQIKTAADAWVKTRLAWERTEAYLFGPVDDYAIDPGIDSWPLALADLADFIADKPSPSAIMNDNGEMKGFHTIEFLLFNDGAEKSKLDSFTLTTLADDLGTDVSGDKNKLQTYEDDLNDLDFDEIKSFLVSITAELYRNTARLVAEWDSIDNQKVKDALSTLPSEYAAALVTNGGGDYRANYINAGDEDESSYSDIKDALSIILEAAAGIAEEVGDVKIKDPYTSGNVLDVESWFSWNSVIDFTDNIVGIKEAYYGCITSAASVTVNSSNVVTLNNPAFVADDDSISAYIASASEDLDEAIKDAIDEAIVAVSSLEYPFRNNLDSDTIDDAMEACLALQSALETAQEAINNGFYIE